MDVTLTKKKKESSPFEKCLELFKKKKRRANNCCRCSVKALTANAAEHAIAPLVNKSPRGGHAVVLGHKYSSRFSQERSTIMVDPTILAEVGMFVKWTMGHVSVDEVWKVSLPI